MLVNILSFHSFLFNLKDSHNSFDQIIIPYRARSDDGKSFHFSNSQQTKNIELNYYRTIDPLKILFYLFREQVYPVKENNKKRIIIGVKACDLKALHLIDKALLHSGFEDPAYKQWRENTLIISSDCDHFHETCSCNLVGGHPYSENGFDLNISVLDDNYLIQIGSERGKEFIGLMKKEISVSESNSSHLDKVKSNRSIMLNKLVEKNNNLTHPENYSDFRKVEHNNWEEASKDCIGCGACTNICPTCYCLILNDESTKDEFIKVRSYDSCQWYGYARVAGGGTPRPKMTERFRNRYLCKFDYMNKNFDEFGCTGCGRCTEACAAKIDFREVVKKVSSLAIEVN